MRIRKWELLPRRDTALIIGVEREHCNRRMKELLLFAFENHSVPYLALFDKIGPQCIAFDAAVRNVEDRPSGYPTSRTGHAAFQSTTQVTGHYRPVAFFLATRPST